MSEHAPGSWRAYRLNAQEVDVPWEIEGDSIVDPAGDCPRGIYCIAEVNQRRPDWEELLELFRAAPETARQRDDLLAAAEPFAEMARTIPSDWSGPGRITVTSLTIGQFRAIAAAVAAAVAATKGE